ncbi:MAG: hypothetical protein GXP16_12985 [Gammaproteobacteria bacterium]|nr:hypothetical protein [Gammaproteobacteria bacterium]
MVNSGYQWAKSKIEGAITDHYAFSVEDGLLTEETAKALTDLILQLTPSVGSSELIQSNQGIHHLLIRY